MPDKTNAARAQFRADEPSLSEQESVRTTIVGGRPPGSGKPLGDVPRGIEILLKKAAIDPEFHALLLRDPESAARSIELNLDAVELMMLQTIPSEQLTTIIKQTNVPQPQRRAFLGQTAAAMLAVLSGTALVGCRDQQTKGIRPDDSRSAGIAPDLPEDDTPSSPQKESSEEETQ